MNGKAWPLEWVDELRRMRAAAMSNSQIARALNEQFPSADLSRSAVIGKALRLGISSLIKPSHPTKRAVPAEVKQPSPKAFTFQRSVRPAPPDGPPAPICEPVTLEQLTPHICRWPIGPSREHGWRYCGKPRDSSHRSYCGYHRSLAVPNASRRATA